MKRFKLICIGERNVYINIRMKRTPTDGATKIHSCATEQAGISSNSRHLEPNINHSYSRNILKAINAKSRHLGPTIKAWAIWASTQQFESTPNGAKYLIQSQKFHSSYGPTEAKRYYVNIYLRYMGQQYQAERPKPTPPGARRPILDSSFQMSNAE